MNNCICGKEAYVDDDNESIPLEISKFKQATDIMN
jgi:hypothetical protein